MARAPVFLDTGYFVALLNRRDRLHPEAMHLSGKWAKHRQEVLTSDAVLIELANFFSRSPLRTNAIAAIRKLRRSGSVSIAALPRALLGRAETRYASHIDKAWSLTDCISMELMLDEGALDVATPDHHFTQAGFKILMG